jgi:hypothetical protein
MIMDPVDLLALAKAVSSDELDLARQSVAPGKYQIDAKIHLVGEISVGKSTEKTPTSSTPWLTVCALILKKSGFQKELAIPMIMDAVREAITLDKDASEALLVNTGVQDVKDRLAAEYKKLPKTPVAGQVRASLKLTKVVKI